jgi:hypothetical protein
LSAAAAHRDITATLEYDIGMTHQYAFTATHGDNSGAGKRDETAIIAMSVPGEFLGPLIDIGSVQRVNRQPFSAEIPPLSGRRIDRPGLGAVSDERTWGTVRQ